MHETSVATKVVAASVEEAQRRGLQRVRAIRLRLGALWGIEPTSFAFQVTVFARGTLLEGAHLTLEMVPSLARCKSCGMEVKDPRLDDPGFLHNLAHGMILVEALLSCRRCGDGAVAIEQGRELDVVEVEG
jgi:hydrogenase nickel incorporation protein HypA/HybF